MSRHPRGPFWIDPGANVPFPPAEWALEDPDGLLAVGADLSPQRLLDAYRGGIFPWYQDDQPILWWSPNPRTVLYPGRFHMSRSLRRTLRRGAFRATLDQAFEAVVGECAAPGPGREGTWITPAMTAAYGRLHRMGRAHSIEIWEDQALVGGLYGVALGGVFFGESMFSRRSDASKVAMAYLLRQLQAWGFALLDCQVHNPHLETLGAERIPRREFLALLDQHADRAGRVGPWRLEIGAEEVLGG